MSKYGPTCERCGAPRIQLPRLQLMTVGFAMVLLGATLPWLRSWLLLLAVPLALGGGFLLLWGAVGKGLWCSHCMSF